MPERHSSRMPLRPATALIFLSLVIPLLAGVPATSAAVTLNLSPVADAWVDSSAPSTNMGSHNRLKVRTAAKQFESYLRFTVTGAGAVSNATLRLSVADGSAVGGSVYATSSEWTEAGLTWNTRPAPIGNAIAVVGPAAPKSTISLDLSSVITGDGTYSFVLTGGAADAVAYHSRESTAAKRPQLVITTGGEPPPSAPVNIAAPTVSPASPERAIHFARPGSWTVSDPTFSYQWERCVADRCDPIAGATTERYAVTPDDFGAGLRVAVTAANAVGQATAYSSVTGPIGPTPEPAPGSPVVAVAGDIACDPDSSGFAGGVGNSSECRQLATSDLLVGRGLSGVLIPGDIQYNIGEYDDFLRSYDLSWGRLNGITYPAPGNHEYGTPGAVGYFRYFGSAAGTLGEGWYSFDIGSWHIVALNSDCDEVPCGPGSPQEQWLRQDLAASTAACTLAYWHHPRFSSGEHGDEGDVSGFWQALYEYGADVVVNGHDHDYERFAPQTPAGVADPAYGIREFVVGTGGKGLRGFNAPVANSEARNSTDFGVLELTLGTDGYSWEFIPIAGQDYTDTGSGSCHGAPVGDPPPPPPPPPGDDALVWASAETDPVPHGRDAADDAAIWVHPTDPSLSTVIGTDKQPGGGLAVYDLDGNELYYYGGVAMNNVDIIDGFALAGTPVSLVAATDRLNNAIALYRVDPSTRGLVNVASRLITGAGAGICGYHSAVSGESYVFTVGGSGTVKQWRLSATSSGTVDAVMVRKFDAGDSTEACVADHARGHVYVAEENTGIWRYPAEPGTVHSALLVDGPGPGGHLTPHVEGLALSAGGDGGGYLVASSQGDDRFAVYRRDDYSFVGSFRVVESSVVDGAEHTDGIELFTGPLGASFPGGLFAAQDGDNDDGSTDANQNFKLVPWDSVLDALGESG